METVNLRFCCVNVALKPAATTDTSEWKTTYSTLEVDVNVDGTLVPQYVPISGSSLLTPSYICNKKDYLVKI